MSAVVAVVESASVGKPSLRLPDVPLPRYRVDDRHPPIVEDKYEESYHISEKEPEEIINSEKYQIETAVFTALIRELDPVTAALRALSVYSHCRDLRCYLYRKRSITKLFAKDQ